MPRIPIMPVTRRLNAEEIGSVLALVKAGLNQKWNTYQGELSYPEFAILFILKKAGEHTGLRAIHEKDTCEIYDRLRGGE